MSILAPKRLWKQSDSHYHCERQRKVLLICDNAAYEYHLRMLIALHRFSTFTAESVEDAVNAFSLSSFDLIVADLEMPRDRGIDLLSTINQSRIYAPIVLIRGEDDWYIAHASPPSFACHHFDHPLNDEALDSALLSILCQIVSDTIVVI